MHPAREKSKTRILDDYTVFIPFIRMEPLLDQGLAMSQKGIKIDSIDYKVGLVRAERLEPPFTVIERGPRRKSLIEFLLINCLRGATIIATHELSHYRNCGAN